MGKLEVTFILFLFLMLVVFLIDYIFIKRRYLKKLNKKGRKKKKDNNELTEVIYLVNKFRLNKNELNLKRLLLIISLINSFIISLVAVVIISLKIFILFKFIIGFILLIALIYSVYELLGRHLVKVERENGK